MEKAPTLCDILTPKKMGSVALLSEAIKERYVIRCNKYRIRMVSKLYRMAKRMDEKAFQSLSHILTIHSKAFRV